MISLQATPFVPGRVRGTIRHGVQAAAPDSLLVVTHEQLNSFDAASAGLIVVGGAPLSHRMIRLLGLGVPTVMVTEQQADQLMEGTEAILDGTTGLLSSSGQAAIVGPHTEPQPPQAATPVNTANGQSVALCASIANLEGAKRAVRYGATAIGLIRSEFLVTPDGRRPDADFYTATLTAIGKAADPLSVTVRLLDIAADKMPPWLEPIPGMGGPLGLQGSRVYGIEPVRSVFHAQVAAMGQLASQFDLRVLVPYVARPEEFVRWRREIETLLPAPMAIGAMAETPAAALSISELLALADFVAIGCNDMMQCLFAADRDVVEVGHLLDPYAPAVFRLLRQVARAVGDAASEIQLCGLLPQVPAALPVLLGLGYRAFSVEPLLIPFLARTVEETDTAAAAPLAVEVCAAPDAASVRTILDAPGSAVGALGLQSEHGATTMR